MTLFKGQPDEVVQTNDEDRPAVRLARKLTNFLRSRSTRPVHFKRWTKSFQLLIDNGAPASEVEETLDWYIQASNDRMPNLPPVQNAYDFCERYDRIRTRVLLDPNQGIKVDSAAERIVNELKGYKLPSGLDQFMPMIVQRSLEAFKDYVDKVDRLYDGITKKVADLRSRSELKNWQQFTVPDDLSEADKAEIHRLQAMARLIRRIRDDGLLNSKVMVSNWCDDITRMAQRWTDWSGTLTGFVFDYKHDRYANIVRTHVSDWCGSSKRWDDLMKELK